MIKWEGVSRLLTGCVCVCVFFFNVLMGGKSAKNYCVVCYIIL